MSRRRCFKLREWLAELDSANLHAVKMPRHIRKAVAEVYARERRYALSRQSRFECSMTSYDALMDRLESSDKSAFVARHGDTRHYTALDGRQEEVNEEC